MEVNTLKRKLKAEEDEHGALNTLWEVFNVFYLQVKHRCMVIYVDLLSLQKYMSYHKSKFVITDFYKILLND